MDDSGNVHQLRANERGESDGDNVEEVFFEEEDGEDHDHAGLIDTLHHPQEKSLLRQNATLLEFEIKLRKQKSDLLTDVCVED